MFTNLDMKRLLELAGMDPEMEKHYSKESTLFKAACDELEKVMVFLKSQEGFEKKRGHEGEYAEMEKDIEDLVTTMKKHLTEY